MIIPWRRHERGPADELLWQTRLRQTLCPRCGRGDWTAIDYHWMDEEQEEYATGIWCDGPKSCGYWQGYGQRGVRGRVGTSYRNTTWLEGPEEDS